MATCFDFYRTPEIIFGAGATVRLPEMISRFGRSVLLVTGAASFQSTEQWEWFGRACGESKIAFEHTTCVTEPSPGLVDHIKDRYRDLTVDVVLGVGGGSVLDCAKAVSAMLGRKESVTEYLEGVGSNNPDGSKTPFIAVPTTSGTGTEATKNAVLSEVGSKGFKKSLRHDNYVPDIALIDPRLMLTCPSDITASCGMDAFTQLLEAYLSPKSGGMLDAMLLDGLENIQKYFLTSVKDGNDLEARTGMAYAALISGIGLANAGLGVVHGFASPIGGFFRIPHGVVCGTLMAPATRVNVRKAIDSNQTRAKEKFARVGHLFSSTPGKSAEFYCRSLIENLEQWTRELKIPYLSDYGIAEDDLPEIIKKTGIKNNPVALNQRELEEILLARIN